MFFRTSAVTLLMLSGLLLTCSASAETQLFVAPGGDDQATGSPAEPLASLEGARNRVRQIRRINSDEPIVISFAAGKYFLAEPVTFEADDSGTPNARVTYRAAKGADVHLSGGKTVHGWKYVDDTAILRRLPEEARAHVQVADLAAQGIDDYGRLTVRGFSKGSRPAEAELFYRNQPMTLARWPNDGFRGIEKIDGVTRVALDTDRLARWTEEPDPWIFAYWHHDWADLHEPIVGIEPEEQIIVRKADIRPNYGITPGRARWYAYNLLSELDQPGEYYLDRDSGKLYFWPPTPGGRAVLSIGNSAITCQNLSHVTFRGFTFEAFRASAVILSGGRECRLLASTLRNLGHRAFSGNGGDHHEVYGCDVYYTGEGGISLSGGDRKTLNPANHNLENNHIHHYSRRARTYRPAISTSGVGNRIAHNLVHHGPHMAIRSGGNDHLVEYNEVHNVVYESGDAGAFYVGRDWTQRGNVLRYNYWHHIVGATGHGGMTIYLDDQHSGYTIHGNLFERCSQAVFIGGGDDNVVTNNVFLDSWKCVHLDNRGMGWQKAATDDPEGTLRTRFQAMPTESDLWKRRYPNLAATLEDEPNIPKRNLFARNIAAGGIWNDIYPTIRQYQTVEDNLVYENADAVTLIKNDLGQPVELHYEDPAAVAAIGFEPLPLEKMGLYDDPRRANWPPQREVWPIELPHDEP